MALIKCPECSKDVSDKAPACPNCGAPIAAATVDKKGGVDVTTIQETSKRLKTHLLLASLSLAVGIVWVIIAVSASVRTSLAFPTSLFVGGLVWYAITRFRIWWHHE
jgi:hypothetical protein